MNLDISTFRAVISPGLAKPNKYLLTIPVPYIIQQLPDIAQGLQGVAQYLQYYADSVDLVGVNMQTLPIIRYGYGSIDEHPVAAVFQNVAVSFYADAEAGNLFYFQQWLSTINNFNLQQGITSVDLYGINAYENYYKDDYTVEASIQLLDVQGLPVATWNMREFYPKAIPNSKLAWNANGDIMRVQVLFAMNDWYLNVSQGGTLINAMSTGASSSGKQNIQNESIMI